MTNKSEFAAWLRDALAGRPNVYLVRKSGTKDNGRPVIDDSRVSKWLKGEQRPSMELASLAARVLGRPQSEALKAAGYPYGHSLETIERMEREHPLPTPTFRMLDTRQLDRLRTIHEEIGQLLREIGGDGDAYDTRGSAPTNRAPDLVLTGVGGVRTIVEAKTTSPRPAQRLVNPDWRRPRPSGLLLAPGSGKTEIMLMHVLSQLSGRATPDAQEDRQPLKAARRGTPQRVVTDRPQNEAGEESQDREGFDPA